MQLQTSSETGGCATEPLSVGSLFAGIGGLDLGLERTGGFKTVWFAEIDPFASAVLKRHWPDVPNLGDIRGIGADTPPVDVLAGGFPCQPVSLAGRRLAQEDPRWLWPQFARVIGELRPRYVIVENVPGLASKGLGEVLEDLSSLGYDAEWDIISAASVGASHLRERILLVAYANGSARLGSGGSSQAVYRPEAVERSRRRCSGSGIDWPTEPDVGRTSYGVPHRLDRLRALGNGVVPQVAEFVGHLILDAVKAGRI